MFSAYINLDEDKRNLKAEKKLFALRRQMIQEDPVIHTGPFIEKSKKLMESSIYEILKFMPTPVVHHCHDIASTPVMPEIVKYLCYYDYVYYN